MADGEPGLKKVLAELEDEAVRGEMETGTTVARHKIRELLAPPAKPGQLGRLRERRQGRGGMRSDSNMTAIAVLASSSA